MDSIDDFFGYNFIVLMHNLCFFGLIKGIQGKENGTHYVSHIRQSLGFVSGFKSVATFSLGFQPRLLVATDLKPSTEIGLYGTRMGAMFL